LQHGHLVGHVLQEKVTHKDKPVGAPQRHPEQPVLSAQTSRKA
jgi:hypothetical protein